MDTSFVSIEVISGAEASDPRTIRLHAHIWLWVLPLDIIFSHWRLR